MGHTRADYSQRSRLWTQLRTWPAEEESRPRRRPSSRRARLRFPSLTRDVVRVFRWSMRSTACCATWTPLERRSELTRSCRSWGTSPPWPWSTSTRRSSPSWRRSCRAPTCPAASLARRKVTRRTFNIRWENKPSASFPLKQDLSFFMCFFVCASL